ncbi:hypothetical protein FH972_021067 [Carpinus fangiana]|uniref:Molybdenum cofactor sulfurase n=1 Tax=Carpinus fangiana TaxID=176857 RepID=A0A5N6KN98_9ROSI|nr:hypothetical protein FH972_021067 [Carpinus fangiana]
MTTDEAARHRTPPTSFTSSSSGPRVYIMDELIVYNDRIESMRKHEYPMLKDAVYLDHAGTTLYAKSLIERFSADMIYSLYGNPHSGSTSSQLATTRTENIRHDVLRFFGADSREFDLVFVANATAGIKLVMDAFRDHEHGFWYGYHKDSHTSLVGVREVASLGHRCFETDEEIEAWLGDSSGDSHQLELLAYPAQSNMNGRRLPLDWSQRARLSNRRNKRHRYTLLDAAAYASTTPVGLSHPESSPDFTVVSFNKIFGFPDLGGVIVRNDSAHVLNARRYFGGGTVDMVLCAKEQWHAKKSGTVHEAHEDGTLPIHSIVALGHALDVHQELFESLEKVSAHTSMLANRLHSRLASMRHRNGKPTCELYREQGAGAIVSFNIKSETGEWVSNTEVERLASIKSFHIRSGGLCNPGGIASTLGLQPWELKANFSAGQRCGAGDEILGGKVSGMTRVSFGAMSTLADVDSFVEFIQEYFVSEAPTETATSGSMVTEIDSHDFYVESLTVYPMKSCAGWRIPEGSHWEVRAEGLAWDREWCLVHQGTNTALSQKKYNRMALIRPEIDLQHGILRIRYTGSWNRPENLPREIEVPLSADPTPFEAVDSGSRPSLVCDDKVTARRYASCTTAAYFTLALGVPCQLARFPPTTVGLSTRHMKQQLGISGSNFVPRPLLLSNESPILTISRSSLNRLNEEIKARGGRAAQAESFRANIVVAQALGHPPGHEQPYAEDAWSMLRIGSQYYQLLGSCRRCQMVCIDQETAEKTVEPFATLAKTRRAAGKVWFGQHTSHLPLTGGEWGVSRHATIKVGDNVRALHDGKECDSVLQAALHETRGSQ